MSSYLLISLIYIVLLKIDGKGRLAIIYLILLSAIRYDYGGDYMNYHLIYENNYDSLEYGFFILIKFFKSFNISYRGFIACLSLVNLSLFYIFIRKYFKNKVQNIMLLFFLIPKSFFYNLVIIRQALAAVIFLYALEALRKNKKINYILLIYIASFFHKGIIIFIIFIFWGNDYKRVMRYLILVSILIFIVPIKWYIDILNILNLNRYIYYFFNEDYTYNISLFYTLQIIFLIYLIFIFYWRKIYKNSYCIYFITFFIAIVIELLKLKFLILVRINSYFSYVYPITYLMLLEINTKNFKRILYFCFILYFCYFVYSKQYDYFYRKYRVNIDFNIKPTELSIDEYRRKMRLRSD